VTTPVDFDPLVARWFAGRFGSPTPPQRDGWAAIAAGRHALIAAPTGPGKTLAEIRDLAAAEGIPLDDVRIADRSGDTPSSERQAMLRRPPHVLITTPESLFILPKR